MHLEKYSNICNDYKTQWNQLCNHSNMKHDSSQMDTLEENKLQCELIQNILKDCLTFRDKKIVKS